MDRLWVEVRSGRPVAVFDIKDIHNQLERETETSRTVHEWFEKNSVPTYIVYIDRDIPLFTIQDIWGNQKTFTEIQMVNWIDRGIPKLREMI